MKRDEAEQVFGILSALYDLHPERRGEQGTIWIPALEEMDADNVMVIVNAYMKGKGPEKMPTLPYFITEVRVAELRRNPARSYDDPPDCDVCEDNAQVEVVDGMAPCPSCERGKRLEYPLEEEGPWGKEGYWRGQSWTRVAPGIVEVGP